MPITDDEALKIIKILDAMDYGEIHLQFGDLKIDIRRATGVSAAAPPDVVLVAPTPPVATPHDAGLTIDPATLAIKEGHQTIVSPVTGLFYRAPSPGADPFVAIGDTVDAASRICIIEIMKLFTTVPAGVAGQIVAIAPANGALVHKGDVLMVVDPGLSLEPALE